LSRRGSTTWVTESGIKLRFDLTRTPLRFMRKLGTSFFGLRAGIQRLGTLPRAVRFGIR
jgi:hypothetical protein